MPNSASEPTPKPLNPAIDDLTRENKIQILLAAYQKHATELLAIQASQQKLNGLVLGIYSAGLTLVTALAKDAKAILAGPSALALALIAIAILVGAYAVYMSKYRGNARQEVRKGLTRIEQALAFYAAGTYLRDETLYELYWLNYPKEKFLNLDVAIVILVGIAFALGVLLIAIS